MRDYRVVPVRVGLDARGREQSSLATVEPNDQQMLDLISPELGKSVRGVLGCRRDLEQAHPAAS